MEVHCFYRGVNPLNSEGRKDTEEVGGCFTGGEKKFTALKVPRQCPLVLIVMADVGGGRVEVWGSDEVKYGSTVFSVAMSTCEAC